MALPVATSTSREASCAPISTTSSSALYVTIDDLLGPGSRAGRPAASQGCRMPSWSAWRSPRSCSAATGERRWLRFCYGRGWAICSRTCPTSLGLQQAAAPGPLAAGSALAIQDLAARTPSWSDQLRLVDSTPVPCAASRETVKRSALRRPCRLRLLQEPLTAASGASSLYVLAAPDGSPVAWCLASPKLGEREVVVALLDHEQPPAAAGSGHPGRQGLRRPPSSTSMVSGHGGGLAASRPPLTSRARYGSLRPLAPVDRVAPSTPSRASLGWNSHGGRTLAGVYVRVAQRLLALAAAIWWNWQIGAARQALAGRLRPLRSTTTQSESII